MNPRILATHILCDVIIEKISLSKTLSLHLNQLDHPSDKGFCQEITLGTLRYYPSLKKTLEKHAKKPISNKNKAIEVIACCAIYQLIILKSADYAVINETVNLSKTFDLAWAKNFLNAVLRKVSQQKTLIPDRFDDHPEWLWKKLNTAYPEQIKNITKINHYPAHIMLRICQSCPHNRDEYLELLNQQSIDAKAHPDNKDCVVLNKSTAITQLPLFEQGHITVQDANAQLAANLLGVKNHQVILDACAAPGGKTAHIADKAVDLNLIAVDQSAERVKQMQENLSRLNKTVSCITNQIENIDEWYTGNLFNRILLDAPCSATGVIRKHPDILFHRTKEDLINLTRTQQNLLHHCWKHLAIGGRLLYATCSILPEENIEQIKHFLTLTPNAKIIPLGHNRATNNSLGSLQFLPSEYGDGFFYALLEKTE